MAKTLHLPYVLIDAEWDVMAFAGAGVGRSMTYNTYALDYSAGVHSSWKVAKKTSVFVEAGVNTFDHNIDNCKGVADRSWKRRCNNFYAEVGLTFNLGSAKWKKCRWIYFRDRR